MYYALVLTMRYSSFHEGQGDLCSLQPLFSETINEDASWGRYKTAKSLALNGIFFFFFFFGMLFFGELQTSHTENLNNFLVL